MNGDWPLLYLDPLYNAKNMTSLLTDSCTVAQYGTTSVSVSSILDSSACIEGKSEIQVIVLEGLSGSLSAPASFAGYFYLYYLGKRSDKIPYDVSADNLESILNNVVISNDGNLI